MGDRRASWSRASGRVLSRARAAVLAALAVAGAAGGVRAAPTAGAAVPALDPAASTDEGWRRAAALVAAAAAEADPARAADAWEIAARALDDVVAADHVGAAARLDAARAAWRAWEAVRRAGTAAAGGAATGAPHRDRADDDAAPTPRPLDARDARAVAAIGRYLELAPTAPDVAAARFTRARIALDADRLDDAEADLGEIVAHHADADVASFAAELLLDALNRQGRTDELLRHVAAMRADAAWMARDPELAARLAQLARAGARLDAERALADGDRGDPTGYARCAAAFRALHDAAPAAADADEVAYDAGVCAEKAGDVAAAIAAYRAITAGAAGAASTASGRGALIPHADARLAALYTLTAAFPEAAAAWDDLARRFPAEREAADAAWNAIAIRVALGDLDGAERGAARYAKTYGARDPDGGLAPGLAVARARLDRDAPGDRRAAARATGAALTGLHHLLEPAREAWLDALAWDAACPRAATDGLCLDGARVLRRDPRLADAALARARALPDAPAALALAAARAAEDVLALPGRGAALATAARRADDAFDALDRAAADLDARLGGLAQRGRVDAWLARAAADPARKDAAIAALTACRELASATMRPTPWLASCDAQLAALGVPAPPTPELAPPAPAGRAPRDLEGPAEPPPPPPPPPAPAP